MTHIKAGTPFLKNGGFAHHKTLSQRLRKLKKKRDLCFLAEQL